MLDAASRLRLLERRIVSFHKQLGPVARAQQQPALKPIDDLGLTMHGLRATKIVRVTLQGLSDGDIASLYGLHEETVRRYRRLAQQRIKAAAAVIRLDDANGTKTKRDHGKRLAGSMKYNPAHPIQEEQLVIRVPDRPNVLLILLCDGTAI